MSGSAITLLVIIGTSIQMTGHPSEQLGQPAYSATRLDLLKKQVPTSETVYSSNDNKIILCNV